MITRSFIICTLSLLLVTSIAIILLLHRHAHNRLEFEFGAIEHRAVLGNGNARRRNAGSRKHAISDDDGANDRSAATTPSIEFTTNFTFPSRQTRLKYYMGDWFDRVLRPTTDDAPWCRELTEATTTVPGAAVVVSDRAVLWSVGAMEREIRANSTRDWLIRAYLTNAYDVLKHGGGGGGGGRDDGEEGTADGRCLLFLGDSHSHSVELPVVAKTRFSRFAVERSTGRPFFATIVWPMEMHRHYNPIREYLKLKNGGEVREWKDKKPTLIWRGGVTGIESDKNLSTTYPLGGPRLRVVSAYFGGNASDVDVAFRRNDPSLRRVPFKYRNVRNFVRGRDTSMADQLKYKYILSLEGNDVATGLKWQLASNSVVFMARPTTASFLMEDSLIPYVHYIPLEDDYSDLINAVRWARENDERCEWISRQATEFMRRLWIGEEARRENAAIKVELGEAYNRQFQDALATCDASWSPDVSRDGAFL